MAVCPPPGNFAVLDRLVDPEEAELHLRVREETTAFCLLYRTESEEPQRRRSKLQAPK